MRKIFIMMTMLVNGCAAAQSVSAIHGIKYQQQKLHILVTSTGCTTEKSFRLYWQAQNLTIVRVKADHCRRMPHKLWLEFDVPKEKANFTLTNSINQ
ncbi:hypothetical protein tinsulaeT_36350 [Thalassotalea insulae]|uniref:DUF3019 domain-containing protein n=1 Tax=Thalassotalea insulae TaxID=2056778 RepID=A0ABQ6GWJ9_9GAMM|nr:hypothetical protein [Thalassotalea insulae]GLX80295.1 hypothetical protein tinsulaeT_36350 [Thalassotalea insulae]